MSELDEHWENWKSETFLSYVETHSDKSCGLFSMAMIERLYQLAGHELPSDLYTTINMGGYEFVSLPNRYAMPLVRAAKLRMRKG